MSKVRKNINHWQLNDKDCKNYSEPHLTRIYNNLHSYTEWESETSKNYSLYHSSESQLIAGWIITPVKTIKSTLSLETERQFTELANRWKKETMAYSATLHITRNDNYLDIIGMGKEVVPFILLDLEKAADHWFVALKAITKENPIPKEHFGNIEKMRQDWLSWGRKNELI